MHFASFKGGLVTSVSFCSPSIKEFSTPPNDSRWLIEEGSEKEVQKFQISDLRNDIFTHIHDFSD